MNNINKIFLLGGTHGNEPTGVYIIKNWDNFISSNFFNHKIQVIPLISNPKACANKVRYIDQDLNRSFTSESLSNQDTLMYEEERAKILNKLISDDVNNTNNFIIDIHTTNANMGITIETSTRDIYKLNLLKYISNKVGNINVIYTDDAKEDRPFLNSITKNSLLIEMGGIANNIISHNILEKTTNVINATIEFLHKIKNNLISLDTNIEIEAFTTVMNISFPRDKRGNIKGVIHKNIQGRDYVKKINYETKIFKLFNGKSVRLDQEGEYYMSYINESAYYEKDIAFCLIEKTILSV